jgi:hypothetical protein
MPFRIHLIEGTTGPFLKKLPLQKFIPLVQNLHSRLQVWVLTDFGEIVRHPHS